MATHLSRSVPKPPQWPARALRRAALWWHQLAGRREDASRLAREAHGFWNEVSAAHGQRAQESHWRGHGVFADDALWLKLGHNHLELLQRTLQAQGRTLRAQHVVDWGCGGGMNAVHFSAGARSYHGVDVSAASLQECERQLRAQGCDCFVPVLVHPDEPEAALAHLAGRCDLFLCTYVFELLPSEAHALRLLDVVRDALMPGGIAMLHFRVASRGPGGTSRPWGYARNMAHNVRFSTQRFAQACSSRQLGVLATVCVEEVPELHERDYAYVVVERTGGAPA